MEGDEKAKAEEEMDAAAANDPNYPPLGISPGVQKLEQWIQVGCGDKPYYCEEKGATFGCATLDRKRQNGCSRTASRLERSIAFLLIPR